MPVPLTRLETRIDLPAILTSCDDAITRFIEHFTAHIRNPHTRRAYLRNAKDFLRWCEARGIGFAQTGKACDSSGLHRDPSEKPLETHGHPRWFQATDRNRGGVISPWEFVGPLEVFRQ